MKTTRQWQHDHTFGQDQKRPGEVRTIIVIAVTAVMMIVELTAGVIFGSMALLADGLHMASHAAALSISAFAYVYARRNARDERFTFGTGKVNALGGFTGALLLAGFALIMVWESVERLASPVEIAFNQAIGVAVLGLIVNGASVFILGHTHHNDHHGAHSHDHDHNLQAAYFHVLADALTSVLAIFALLAAKYYGLVWMDPMMGIVGALLVSRWAVGLLKMTSAVLLDRRAPKELLDLVRNKIEDHEDNRVADLHVWSIGPNIYAAEISIVTEKPNLPEHYKELIPNELGIVHACIEIHPCVEEP